MSRLDEARSVGEFYFTVRVDSKLRLLESERCADRDQDTYLRYLGVFDFNLDRYANLFPDIALWLPLTDESAQSDLLSSIHAYPRHRSLSLTLDQDFWKDRQIVDLFRCSPLAQNFFRNVIEWCMALKSADIPFSAIWTGTSVVVYCFHSQFFARLSKNDAEADSSLAAHFMKFVNALSHSEKIVAYLRNHFWNESRQIDVLLLPDFRGRWPIVFYSHKIADNRSMFDDARIDWDAIAENVSSRPPPVDVEASDVHSSLMVHNMMCDFNVRARRHMLIFWKCFARHNEFGDSAFVASQEVAASFISSNDERTALIILDSLNFLYSRPTAYEKFPMDVTVHSRKFPRFFVKPRSAHCFISPLQSHKPGSGFFVVNVLTGEVEAHCREPICARLLKAQNRSCKVLRGPLPPPPINDLSINYEPGDWRFSIGLYEQISWRANRSLDLAPDLIVAEMNRHFCVITSAPNVQYACLTITHPDENDPNLAKFINPVRTYQFYNRPGFDNLLSHKLLLKTTNDKGKEVTHPTTYAQVFRESMIAVRFSKTIFNPVPRGEPGCPGADELNLFSGLRITRALADQWMNHFLTRHPDEADFLEQSDEKEFGIKYPRILEPFLVHVRDVISNRNRASFAYVMGYLASLIQFYWVKLKVALLIKGEHGSGKGYLFSRVLAKIIGRHFRQISNPQSALGSFNGIQENALVLFFDELDLRNYGGQNGSKDSTCVQNLKILISEEKWNPSLKHQNPDVNSSQPASYVNVVMASNEDQCIYMPVLERRFAVIEAKSGTGGIADDNSKAYFDKLWNVPVHAIAWALYQSHWTDPLNFHADKVPLTAALEDQKLQSMPPSHRWWLGILKEGSVHFTRNAAGLIPEDLILPPREDSDYTKKLEFFDNYRAVSDYSRADMSRFWKELKKVVDISERRGAVHRQAMICFPSLTRCRQQWANYMRQRVTFPGVVDGSPEEDYDPVVERQLPELPSEAAAKKKTAKRKKRPAAEIDDDDDEKEEENDDVDMDVSPRLLSQHSREKRARHIP